jgi:hypothetical protein
MRRIFHHGFALLTAYALALQVVLAAAVAVPPALGEPSIPICRADDSEAPAIPTHEQCAACLSGHCASPTAAPERAMLPAPWRGAAAITEGPPPLAFAARARAARAYAPRAPPA